LGEGFALKAKGEMAEEEVGRQVGELQKAVEKVLEGVRREMGDLEGRMREEYEEPSFESAEEREAHVGRTIEVLNAVSESYLPGKKNK
jgi:hypothetical protein